MEFDKSRVYTALNADELHVGDIVICDDTISNLRKKVTEEDVTPYTGIITKILDDSFTLRFECTHCKTTYFAYLVKRKPELKYVPWNNKKCPLKCGDNLVSKYNSKCTQMVTGVDFKCDGTKNISVNGIWLSYVDIFNEFVFSDGTPCGAEVNV